MKSHIHELGIIDKNNKKHAVKLKEGLNVITGKSSTGKSAIIEIFDYCFASSEYTIPKGVITEVADIYYVYININDRFFILGRSANNPNKAFAKEEDDYYSDAITKQYFTSNHFIPLENFKKFVLSHYLDIEDVDESLIARENRRNNSKAATPSIRSFTSFMLQHQNLIANKHALFYRFDEKAKRDQAIEHSKIFLGLVDQQFYFLSQEKERLQNEIKIFEKEQKRRQSSIKRQQSQLEPLLSNLYAAMGFNDAPITVQQALQHPQNAKKVLEKTIQPNAIAPLSDAIVQRQIKLQEDLAIKTSNLRKLQRKANSLKHHLDEEERLKTTYSTLFDQKSASISRSVCPFCHAENDKLSASAEQLHQAVSKLASNLRYARPMRAKFESLLTETNREIEDFKFQVKNISTQLAEIDRSEKVLQKQKNLYQSILSYKSKVDFLLDLLSEEITPEEDENQKNIFKRLQDIEQKLALYDYKTGLQKANSRVNKFMKEIGIHFNFEDGYQPINLHFSFETFDLYHLTPKEEKIFLRSMGSGANWLYSHITLFLALHQHFAELGQNCAIPSIVFFDQPTQVYFPSFKFDTSERFDKNTISTIENRNSSNRQIDDDIESVENLFSQLAAYCKKIKSDIGFSPQLIVTDHADNLTLKNGEDFEDFVNGNRWRTRGLIDITRDEPITPLDF